MATPLRGTSRTIRERYEVVEIVGRGGQGTVAKALDIRHDRHVALKIRRMPSEPLDAERLLGEVRTLLELPPHPGLPVARDDFFDDGNHIMVLDWVDGIDLGRVLITDGAPGLPPSSVLRWAAQVAEALTHLHNHDPPIVHNDIKPSNLILDRRGQVVCVDFGTSSVPGRIQRGGTRGFRAPELIVGGEPKPAADIYSLAATVFALLTGAPPSGLLPRWEGLDPVRAKALEAAIRRGLSIDPTRRPATVGELVELMQSGESATLPTGTVTVLATTIARFAKLWDAAPLLMPAALARHDLIFDRIVDNHNGRRIGDRLSGESTLSVFSGAGQAVQAAIDLNRDLLGACEPVIEVQSGAHSGVLALPRGDGPTINRSGAIRDLAGPGQVLLSATTAGLVEALHMSGVALVPLGEHHLPGFDLPEPVTAISASGLDVPPDPAHPPYPGLVCFEREDSDLYVGRDEAIAALRQLIRPGRIVAVLGASGSGKSSLLRAGLLPHLSNATVCIPGDQPLEAWSTVGSGVVVVDQLEELFALGSDKEVQHLFVERMSAHEPGVVVGLRADAMASLAGFPQLADAVAANHILLAPLRPDQLRDAIEIPAARRGLQLEPGLVDLVLADVADEPGGLPLVAHAMRETWKRRDGRTLTVAGYRASGGVSSAVAATGEAVFEQVPGGERETLRAVLLRMVQPGDGSIDSRRRVSLVELRDLGDVSSIERLVNQLAAARLVTVDAHTVSLAHESLLRAWPRLAEWIGDQREDLRRHRHLTTAARNWMDGERDTGELYRGARLAGAIELSHRASLTATERDFIEGSIEQETREARRVSAANRRLRRLLGGVVVALVVATLAAGIALVQRDRAAQERDRANTASVNAEIARLGAEARANAISQPDLALLLAVEASRRQDTVDTRSALLDVLAVHPLLVAKLHAVKSGLEAIVWSPDGATLAAPTSDSTGTILWDATTFQPIGQPLATGEPFQIDFDSAFTPDGQSLAVVGVVEQRSVSGPNAGTPGAQIWDVSDRSLVATVPLDLLPDQLAMVGDGRMVILGQPISLPWSGEPPEWAAAVQIVDLETATAGPVRLIAPEPTAAAISGASVIVVSADGTLTIQDIGDTAGADRRMTDLSPVIGSSEVATSLALDAASGRVALGDEAGNVVLVGLPEAGSPDDTAARLLRRMEGDGDVASAMAFSPDGKLLAVGGVLGSTRLFDVETGLQAGTPLAAFAGEVTELAFSPDGTRLAGGSTDRTGSIWRLDGTRSVGAPLVGHADGVVAVLPLPEGRVILTASFDGKVIAHRTDTYEAVWALDTGEPIWTAALDPSGSRVALGGARGRLAVINATDGSTIGEAVRFAHPVAALTWAPSGEMLAVGADGDDGADTRAQYSIVFVDASTLEPRGASVTTTGGFAISLAFSPDGARLAAVIDNNLLRFIDVATRTLEAGYLETVDVPFFTTAWSPNGDVIATGAADGTIQLWDTTTLLPKAPAGRQSRYPARGLAFNNDGSLLASTTEFGTSQLWDVDTGAPIGASLVGGALPITVVTLPMPHRPEIPFVPGFSADGRTLFAGSDAPMWWSLDPQDWQSAACEVAGRELTSEEWARYLPGQVARSTCFR